MGTCVNRIYLYKKILAWNTSKDLFRLVVCVFEALCTHRGQRGIQYTIYNIQYTIYNIQYTIYI